MSSRDQSNSSQPGPPWTNPQLQEVQFQGGRRYEACQEYESQITNDQLDHQTQRFYEEYRAHYKAEYPSKKQDRYIPNAAAGQAHGEREVYFSSTERVNEKVGQGQNVRNSAYNQAVEKSVYQRHNSYNRCAEGGTTGMIQRRYGDNVDMRGDRISTYGEIPDELGQKAFLGFHPGCASGKGGPEAMGCEDVLDEYGIIDIHGRKKNQKK